MKKFYKGMNKLINCIAILLVIQGANSACTWVIHQPKFPEEANQYKKVK